MEAIETIHIKGGFITFYFDVETDQPGLLLLMLCTMWLPLMSPSMVLAALSWLLVSFMGSTKCSCVSVLRW
jgi:hypothetical protein